jgi:hypothetical protein
VTSFDIKELAKSSLIAMSVNSSYLVYLLIQITET